MALIRIDDREIEAPAGENLLRVALKNGIAIPFFCYHPALSVVGQCRMCLVKVEGAPKLLPACSTLVAELPEDKKFEGKYDMVVETASEEVKQAQRGVLELQLINHPLDCPICDQAGECMLQEYAYEYGDSSSRMEFEKVHSPKRVDFGPHIVFDSERCIKCTRCIRFCREITKTNELTMAHRGVWNEIQLFHDRKLDNPYSLCTADLCPVGALTSKEFRFKERVWFLASANSVCPECSRGCSARYDTYRGEILRLVPIDNPKVNGPWMCDYGRLLTERIKGIERLDMPAFRRGSSLERHPWPAFAGKFLEKLSFYRKDFKKTLAVILSGRMTLEELIAYETLSEALFSDVSGTAPNVTRGEDDDLLIRKEKRPNLEGARRLGIAVSEENAAVADLLKGKKTALIVREDPLGDVEDEEAKAALEKALTGLDLLIVADDALTETAKLAHVVIPLPAWHEMEGTTVNFLGTLQKTARVLIPPRNRKPFYEAASLLLQAEGVEAPGGSFGPWFSKVKERIPELSELRVRDLLPHGVRLAGGDESASGGEA